MSGTVFSDKRILIDLLSEELKLLEKIKMLTDEQTRQIELDEFDELGKVLNDRQEVIEKINGLHQETTSLMQSYVSSADYGAIHEIDNLREQIKKILVTCKGLNDGNIEALRHKSELQAEKIEAQSAKRKGIGGYAQATPTSSERFDKKT